jgi:tetratricopeptide (TPR) repeat protein
MAKPQAERYDSVEGMLTAFLSAATGDRIGVLFPPDEILADTGEISDLDEDPVTWGDEPAGRSENEEWAIPPAEELALADPPERQRTWTLIIAGVILTCACLAILFNARGLIDRARDQTPTMQVVTPPRRTLVPEGTVISPIQQLQTAEALATAGENRDAVDAYIKAGEQFLDEGSYLQAARIFKGLVEQLGGPTNVGFQIRDSLTEALFMGAALPGMGRIITEFGANHPEWTVILLVEARALLHQDELEASAQLIDAALLSNPDDVLALALQAEWLIASEDYIGAERILGRLNRRPLQPWLSDHVALLSSEIENAT